MKFALLSFIALLAVPISGLCQARRVSQESYWTVIRASDDRANALPHRKITTSETVTGVKREVSKKDVAEYLPPDREKLLRTTYRNGKASTFELIKVGSDHYCREASRSWVKSKTWCGPNERYSDPASSDTVITVEAIGSDKRAVEHYRYYSMYPSWNNQDDRRRFTEVNTWLDSQKRVTRSETRRGYCRLR